MGGGQNLHDDGLRVENKGMENALHTYLGEETTMLQDTPTPQTDNSIAGGMKQGDTDRAQATGRILISLFHLSRKL
jgi:hypothetical protein